MRLNTMPSKNDISSIKTEVNNKLSTVGKKSGRKAKPVGMKESETITLKVTPAEMEYLQSLAGMIPIGTFVKHFLRTETKLLSDQ